MAAPALLALLVLLASPGNSEAIAPRRLVEVIDIGTPVVSPDGTMVAYRTEQASIERNTYDTVWYVQRVEGGSLPLRVAEGGIPLRNAAGVALPATATWSPDGRWIYYRALHDDRISVWRAAVDGSRAEPVTTDSSDVRKFVLSDDGLVLRYSVGAPRKEIIAAEVAEYDQGIHIDEATPIGQGLFRSGRIGDQLVTQRLAEWSDRVRLLADTPDRWKAVDLATRKQRDIPASEVPAMENGFSKLLRTLEPWKTAKDQRGRVALIRRTVDEDGLSKPGVDLSVLLNRDSKRPISCQAKLCTGKAITSIQWRPGSDDVLFTVTDTADGLRQSIHRWNVRTGEVHPVALSRGLINGGRDQSSTCGSSHSSLVCVTADASRPPRLELVGIESGTHQVLFDPNEALARDMQEVSVRSLRWIDEHGTEFTGQFYPASETGNGKPPLFVSYYWCSGFVRGGYGDEWPLASLAHHGISALCINRAPTRRDAIERYDLGRSAVESAVELLAGTGEIDRSKVGMGGLSFGSEVTLWTAIHSDLLTAASVSSPMITSTFYLIGSMRGESFFEKLRLNWQAGAPDESSRQWRAVSPEFNLDRLLTPILMQMSEQEYVYALDYAIPLIRKRQADLYVFPHEPHQKVQPRHKLAVYERNLDWFRFWLQGFEDDDPRKADQYEHWHTMRSHQCERMVGKDAAVPWYC